MNKFTFEVLCTEDYISDNNRQEGNILMHKEHERRVSEAWDYVGEFSPFDVADTFLLPIMAIRHIEREKGLFYRGNRNGR